MLDSLSRWGKLMNLFTAWVIGELYNGHSNLRCTHGRQYVFYISPFEYFSLGRCWIDFTTCKLTHAFCSLELGRWCLVWSSDEKSMHNVATLQERATMYSAIQHFFTHNSKCKGESSISISIGNDRSQANKPEPNLPTRSTIDRESQTKKKGKINKEPQKKPVDHESKEERTIYALGNWENISDRRTQTSLEMRMHASHSKRYAP